MEDGVPVKDMKMFGKIKNVEKKYGE